LDKAGFAQQLGQNPKSLRMLKPAGFFQAIKSGCGYALKRQASSRWPAELWDIGTSYNLKRNALPNVPFLGAARDNAKEKTEEFL
jgi:hypothetical protein